MLNTTVVYDAANTRFVLSAAMNDSTASQRAAPGQWRSAARSAM